MMTPIFFILVLSLWTLVGASSDPEPQYYTQRLTHFDIGGIYEKITFQQRFFVDETYWAGPKNKGPMLVFFGGETPIGTSVGNVGVINQAAPRLRALVLYIEHRFYGASIPYGSIDAAFFSPTVRSYLNTEEALIDFAEIILSLKANLSAHDSPVIVIGGSYAGMLTAWFRLKYPHIAIGALASSAPILFFEDIPPERDYCSIITSDYERVNRKCADIIRQSWSLIDNISSHPDGLARLSKIFNTCRPLNSTNELKVMLVELFALAAQYNGRYNYWINHVCSPIVTAFKKKNTIEGLAQALFTMATGSCVQLQPAYGASIFDDLSSGSLRAWNWQECSEIVHIRGCKGHNVILPPEIFPNRSQYMQDYRERYETWPHPNWVQTYYGGRDIKDGSNIIFSNGLMDPYSSAGILDDISKTLVATKTRLGSHCLDLAAAKKDDPTWLKNQRSFEIMKFEKLVRDGSQRNSFSQRLVLVIHIVVLLLIL